ncbi:MAG TPA: ribosomal protein S18-alanine N-acetyltransferase [Propionicimonas sp.]|nr:ribosomal protein S18-alanine N-acetyltransferase [Propionicimonas sp.]HRA07013.1 ribosomal protein S18-alanine N-acetyltransferase [Propionicimonas sp.]
MIITHARETDLDDILALERMGFDPAEQWSESAWAEELAAPDRYVLARLDRDARIVAVATFSCIEDMADLHRVIVHPDARGQGIGSSLVRAGLEWAGAVGARRMLLEVRPDNRSAVALYSSLGFVQVSVRRDYYGPGRDAMVMLRPIAENDDWAVA